MFARCVSLSTLRGSISLLSGTTSVVSTNCSNRVGTRGARGVGARNGCVCGSFLSGSIFLGMILSKLCARSFNVSEISSRVGRRSVIAVFGASMSAGRLLRGFKVGVFSSHVVSSAALQLGPARLRLLLGRTPCLVTVSIGGFTRLTGSSVLRVRTSRRLATSRRVPPPGGRPVIKIVSARFGRGICFRG